MNKQDMVQELKKSGLTTYINTSGQIVITSNQQQSKKAGDVTK